MHTLHNVMVLAARGAFARRRGSGKSENSDVKIIYSREVSDFCDFDRRSSSVWPIHLPANSRLKNSSSVSSFVWSSARPRACAAAFFRPAAVYFSVSSP